MLGLKMYIPALILLETNSVGFSTKLSILPVTELNTTTPYFEGSSTFVTYNKRFFGIHTWINGNVKNFEKNQIKLFLLLILKFFFSSFCFKEKLSIFNVDKKTL